MWICLIRAFMLLGKSGFVVILWSQKLLVLSFYFFFFKKKRLGVWREWFSLPGVFVHTYTLFNKK
jgi:hypothetical protein